MQMDAATTTLRLLPCPHCGMRTTSSASCSSSASMPIVSLPTSSAERRGNEAVVDGCEEAEISTHTSEYDRLRSPDQQSAKVAKREKLQQREERQTRCRRRRRQPEEVGSGAAGPVGRWAAAERRGVAVLSVPDGLVVEAEVERSCCHVKVGHAGRLVAVHVDVGAASDGPHSTHQADVRHSERDGGAHHAADVGRLVEAMNDQHCRRGGGAGVGAQRGRLLIRLQRSCGGHRSRREGAPPQWCQSTSTAECVWVAQ